MFGRIGVFAALLSAVAFVAGCSGNTTSAPPPPAITIAMSGAPQSLAVNGTVSLTATVSNDKSNAGVDWTCAPAGACGSFNPAHTASGAATTYTAPAAAGAVTINATATASSKAVATATITINTGSQVTVSITAAPQTLAVSGTASLTATVTNDSSNAGVDWSCTPANTCGSFNPTHTASAAATTYTAPAAAASVTITATSTASASATATATIAVGASGGGGATFAAGNYAFELVGTESAGFVYALVGSVTLDGKGNVTGGEQDINDGHGLVSAAGGDKITGGSYTLGATGGTGTLKLITNNTALGANGTENFSITLVNAKHAFLTQTDTLGAAGGTFDLQTPKSTITGNYSFAVKGAADGSEQEVFGGVIQVTGAGTVGVTVDVNALGNQSTGGTNTGTFTAPDAQGRATMIFGGDNYAVYIVGPEVFRMIVLTSNRQDVGSAYGQGTGAFSAASLTGSFVFRLESAGSGAASFASAGQFTTDGKGNITAGVSDSDAAGTVQSASAFTGTYTLGTAVAGGAPAGAGYGNAKLTSSGPLGGSFGVYAVDPALNILDPNDTSGGGGALLISFTAGVPGYGVILPQATPSGQTFTGNYAVNYRCFTPGGVEQDFDGQINVGAGNAIKGTGDASAAGAASPNLAVALSGTVTADAKNPGRFILPLTVAIGANPPALTFVVYQASTGQLLWVETDTKQYVAGDIEQQH